MQLSRMVTVQQLIVKEPAKNETHIYSRKKYALIPITAVNAFTAFASPEVGVNGKKHISFRVQFFNLKVFYSFEK